SPPPATERSLPPAAGASGRAGPRSQQALDFLTNGGGRGRIRRRLRVAQPTEASFPALIESAVGMIPRRRSGRWRVSLSRSDRSTLAFTLFALVGAGPALAEPTEPQGRANLAGVRMPFVANEGQVDARVAYYAP